MMGAISIAFEVIAGCNSDCIFCYNVWKEGRPYPQGELNLSQIQKLFDYALLGVPITDIYLTGGEPLLRKDLEEIVRYFRYKKINVGIYTNGILLNETRLRALVEAGVNDFHISLLSANKEQHNQLCKNSQGFERACEAITLVKRFQKRCHIGFAATKENVSEAGEVMDLSFALGADSFSIFRFVPSGKGFLNSVQLMPSINQLNDALESLDERMGRYGMPVFIGTPIAERSLRISLKNIKLTRCGAGVSKFTIDYLGNLRLCEQNPNILGNLFQKPFLLLMFNKQARHFRKFAKTKEVDGDCPLLYWKGMGLHEHSQN